ncbi:CYTH domain-containing protein [Massilibacterium senegalense]|uniref:CYTH domain-containing protein n=1 Tax=Massilibacterium senegalense TaxID=1632858 RepID=UPI000780C998|nr:CYTH domain-containing protein [Massilibacterium senegalense]
MQEYEIEFKNLLTKTEFYKLLHHFQLTGKDFFIQQNAYFDTRQFHLKDHTCALRIRRKHGKQVLTLKEPYKEGLLETHQLLNEQEAQTLRVEGKLPEGSVKKGIFPITQQNPLVLLGELSTKRAHIPFKDGLLVLDVSTYLQCEDYEVEYEVSDFQKGESIFLDLLSQFNIPKRTTKNKIQRFFEEKMRITEQNKKEL